MKHGSVLMSKQGYSRELALNDVPYMICDNNIHNVSERHAGGVPRSSRLGAVRSLVRSRYWAYRFLITCFLA
jgi:hypothetical protein